MSTLAPHLNLHLLRLLVAVAEQGSFSRAAEHLHLSQSAVSKGVRTLETQLGIPLLQRAADDNRGNRELALTDAGRSLVEHGRGIFGLARRAAEDVADRIALRRGRLRIGASTTVASYWLPAAMADYLEQYPDIEVEWRVGNTGDIANALSEMHIDIGFVEGEIDRPTLSVSRWREEALQIVVPAGQRVRKVADLAGLRWLSRESGSGTRQVADALLRQIGCVPARRMEIGSSEAIARAVAQGCGASLLPEVVISDLAAAGRIERVKLRGIPPLSRPLFRVEARERAHRPAVQAFLDAL